jgi:hypothetical protein
VNEQISNPPPPTETPSRVVTKPRERGLEGIDVRPVLHRLDGMVGRPWTEVSAKIDALKGMRRADARSAYLRCVGETVATSESVLPETPYFVDANGCLARREQSGPAIDKSAVPVILSPETEAFLSGRVIGVRGTTHVWFVPTGRVRRVPNGIDPETGEMTFRSVESLRQDRPLDAKETQSFLDVSKAERDAILAKAPAHSPAAAN